ncbi:PTPLA-domain-containing protein [Wallemia mellicola]|uniref:Very-long-chain (3R)-3-hydroxyacyl-CoA dehydratase n=2 Tax=Wallemia mellicola TaxID=1708541 RepID=A0A4T0PWB2_9BASI|nr:PTPLA-domain-containing protein [Wallemia mellicola CBS 633.66]TIB74721.1 hypothetical protein E3Q24_00392 [Wallemia mellicola]EIM24202.1 PTPLA-domain-containing protein [Wallemia mellicola CBS 633.66]TIB82672.1 PTPLA-domain-containing protein [Wallemia mellicola]TIB89488.1 PTPLA-domain-containing protein [Wallemia mellicola]TIB91836.1 PTPLA-domain-containing protein [Wallemia mellicola]|eukprot:XP_006956021.1 PTPLA-domain-containing protein [Wallemia mellicola CBS 633.66]
MGGGIKFYLALFNAVSTLGWTAVLALTIKHLYDGNVTVPVQESPVTYFKSAFNSQFCGELLSKARTTYFDIGSIVQFVQSIAILEVVHVIIGFVRSPLPTTAMQVASRLYIVYYIAPLFVQAQYNFVYTTMIIAWSLTEIIRYSFYTTSLVGCKSSVLNWLRYTTFYVLYPLGAGSEATLIASTMPKGLPNNINWPASDIIRSWFFIGWWPGLYIMYTHMMRQRSKALSKAKTN